MERFKVAGMVAMLGVAFLLAPLASARSSAAWQDAGPVPARSTGAYGIADRPYPVFDVTPAITMPPLLLDMSRTSVEIVWMTDAPADARVRYGEGKLDHVAVPQTDGLVPVDTVHRVILRGLQPGHAYRYQVESRRVIEVRPYWPEMGRVVKSPVRSFTTFGKSNRETRFAFITDTHEDVKRIDALMKMIHDDPVDFVVDGGDIVNYAVDGNQLRHKFLGPVSEALEGRRPLIYVRGNHENRGPYARSLGKYLHAQNGHYFYTRDDGPLHLVVVDTGEDKPDAVNVYAGLDDMRDYKRDERAWFARAMKQPRTRHAPFTVVLGHQPLWGWSGGHRDEWMKLANQAHVDLFIAGHVHRFEFIKPGSEGNEFPILVVGQDQVAHVTATDTRLEVTVTDRSGKRIDAFTLRRQTKR